MAVGVPGSVTTAALALLGITGAIATYVASNYEHLTLFYVFASVSAILMIWSVWQGTRGITELTNEGYQGKWSVETKEHRFDKQSGAALLGLLALGIAVIVGFTAKSKPPQPLTIRVTMPAALTNCVGYYAELDQLVDDEPHVASHLPGGSFPLDATAKACGLRNKRDLRALIDALARR